MQQTIGLKRFAVTHVAATALAIGVLLSGTLGVAGLAATGNLPWTASGESQVTAPQPVVLKSLEAERTAQLSRFFDAKMARLEAGELHASALAARAAQQDTLRRFYEHKEVRLEAAELNASAAAARAAAHMTILRFYRHKEEKLLTMP